MDKFYQILEIWTLEDFLSDHDIDNVDVIAALDLAGIIDVDDIILRYRYDEDEEDQETQY